MLDGYSTRSLCNCVLYSMLFSCEPVCDSQCDNGRCVAPNSCVCDEEYEKNLEGKCVRRCSKECKLGWCEENECRCYDGYTLDPEDDGRCVAQCEPECQNGNCVQPNVCQCLPGKVVQSVQPLAKDGVNCLFLSFF